MNLDAQTAAGLLYDHVASGRTWFMAALDCPLIQRTNHRQMADAARRITKRWARMYGEDWPIEGADDRDGREAYRAARMSPWKRVARQYLYESSAAAERSARGYAERSGEPWPPERTTAGQMAYELRADTYATWVAIAEAVDRRPDYIQKAARIYAEREGLPWPIEPPTRASAVRVYRDTGALAYRMRRQGAEWPDLAAELGISHEFAHRKAQEHAYAKGLMWPILLPDSPEGRAYEMRIRGVGWNEIAEKEGKHLSVVKARAQRYAKAHGYEWPMRVRPVRKGYSETAEAAYRMGYVESRPWKEVVAALGYSSCQAALNSAKVYAKRFGLPYHAQTRKSGKRDGRRKQQSYEMKVANPEMTWAEVSTALGYRADRGAHTAAKKWAEEQGLPWPPR